MSARKSKRNAEADARADAKAKARARSDASDVEAGAAHDDAATDPLWGRAAFLALLGLSVGMLGVRFYAAQVVGFGDSEALYACYAAHPQPAFLDHPGLVGLVARAIGEGAIPTPLRVHAVTSLVATLVPWIVFWTARAAGAARGPAALAGLIIAVIPETSVGLFALTPDLLLAPAWLGVLALAAVAMRATAGSNRSATGLHTHMASSGTNGTANARKRSRAMASRERSRTRSRATITASTANTGDRYAS
jgi:hypothetical protein